MSGTPFQVKVAYAILAVMALFVVVALGFAAWQEQEIRVLMLIFGVALSSFWAMITVMAWRDKDGWK